MIDLTALILTYNERENIERTLSALTWVREVLLVDSGSDDGTIELAQRTLPKVRIVERAFDSFAGQCNYGLGQVRTEWVLSIDADYVVTEALAQECQALTPEPSVAGYSAAFVYSVFGRPLRSTLYPDRTVLYRKALAHYIDEGHGHRVVVSGSVIPLRGRIDHDDRKPLSRWLRSQDGYTKVEARHLLQCRSEQLAFQDKLRLQIYFAAPVMLIYLLFVRGLVLDGWPGWYYVAQRVLAELLLSLRLLTERYRLEAGEAEIRS